MIRLLLLLLAVGGGAFYLTRLLERRRRERLALVRAAFLVSPTAAADRGPDLKQATLRSGAVSLQIPGHWSEEYPDRDHAAFRDPGSPQRVLRVASERVAGADLRALLQARAGREASTLADLPDGRLLLKCLDADREDGHDVLAFRWLTAVAAPPSQVHLTSFVLTLPEAAGLDPLTRDLVAVLDREVRSARGGAE